MLTKERIRLSKKIPLDAVNLAWIQLPEFDPEENVSIIDTARFVAENMNLFWRELLPESVSGIFRSEEAVSGDVYYTDYNVTPSATGTISSGVATYQQFRFKTNEVTPSGFVVERLTSQIRLEHPRPDRSGAWYLRVQDGVIFRKIKLSSRDQSWLRKIFSPGDTLGVWYTIPESVAIPVDYDLGSKYTDERVVTVSGAYLTVVDDHTLQFPDTDLVDVLSLTVGGEQLITAASGQIRLFDGQLPPRGPFVSWDPDSGQVVLARSLSPDGRVVATYRYREHLYLFNGYRDDSGTFHELNLNPAPGQTYDGGKPTSGLVNQPIYIYLLPSAAYRISRADGTVEQRREIYSGLRWTKSFLRWEIGKFENTPTTEASSDPCKVRSTFGHVYWGTAKFVDSLPLENLPTPTSSGSELANFPSAVVLGKVYVAHTAQIESVRVIDTRVRGGGIPEEIDPADQRIPGTTRKEIGTYWDIGGFDGQPVPLAGAVLVEIPRAVLSGENGFPKFSDEEIVKIVNQHVAAGIKVIIRYV